MGNSDIHAGNLSMDRTSFYRKSHSLSVPLIVCFAIPAVLIIGAYLYMTTYYQKLWLFNTIVHENGKYTLLEVIFYFRHFSWEMLIKTVYAFFTVGAFYFYGNPLSRNRKVSGLEIPSTWIALALLFVVVLLTTTVAATVKESGISETLLGFFQYKTAETRPLVFGSHWRNHFISNIVLLSSTSAIILLYRIVFFNGQWMRRKFNLLFPLSCGIFIVLTLVFGFTTDPFVTPSYLGHQLREIFGTDLTVTMAMAIGVLIYLERKFDSSGNRNKVVGERQVVKFRSLIIWGLSAVIPAIFLIVMVLSLDVSGEISSIGKTADWSVIDLFAWHFFEHSLDYIWVISLVSFLYLVTLKNELGGTIIEK